jgi:H+/Cl- antiporter ClcA
MTETATWRTKANFILFALALGAIVGAVVWLFLFLMNAGLTMLWDLLPTACSLPTLPVFVCIIGGVILGFYEKRFGSYPDTMEAAMAEVKQTGGYAYGNGRLLKGAIGALLPLVFGGSIGPEAGLTGTVAGLCTYVGDRIKSAGVQAREFTTMGISATLSALFNAPLYGFVVPFEDESGSFEFTRTQKAASYIAAVLGGMAAMTLLKSLFGGGMALPRFDAASIVWEDAPWIIPFALAGVALALLYRAADHASAKIAERFGDHLIARSVVCGCVLGCIGIMVPLSLFAGESQTEIVKESWTVMGWGTLIVTGLIKTCLTPYCIHNGWRGGNIFPLIFSGVCIGYGLALLTGVAAELSVCIVVATLCGAVMRKPLSVIALLLLCFPLQSAGFLALGSLIGSFVPLPWSAHSTDERV